MRTLKQKLGFTLVELMVVVALLGAFATLGVPAIKEMTSSSGKRSCATILNSAQSAIQKAVDNKCVFERDVPLDENNGNLRLYITNLDDICCSETGERFIITNENKVYCPHHEQYSGMVIPPINLSGGRVPTDNVGDDDNGDDSDSNNNNGGNITQPEPEPEPEHTCTYTKTTITKQATCTETGLKTSTCSCGDSIEAIIPATGHKLNVVVVEATCGHPGTETTSCTACDYTQTIITAPATGQHQWVTGLYNDGSIGCEVCRHRQEGGYTVTAETPATCTTAGSRTYTCNWDGCVPRHQYTEEVPATGHTASAPAVTKAATCNSTGIQEIRCTSCNILMETQSIAATGNHNYVNQDNTNHKCSSCNKTEAHKFTNDTCSVCGAIKSCSHSYTSKVTAATCTSTGTATYTCSKCGDSYSETIAALGHNYSIVQSITYPYYLRTTAITKTGSITLKCSRCSETTTQTIASSSSYCTNSTHSNKITSTTTKATCTEDGSIVYKCSKCSFTHTITLPATGHTFVDGTCSVCGATDGSGSGSGSGDSGDSGDSGECKHSYTKTNNTTHTCTSCGLEGNHISSSVVSYTYPLYSTSGSFTHYCAKCNSNYTESFSTNRQYCGLGDTMWGTGSTEHNMVPTVTAPTCTTDGYTTYKCNKTITYNYKQQTCIFEYKSDYVPATGHNFVDGVCSSCGATS